MKAWFVSDIHITEPEDPRLALFNEFLRARMTDGTTHVFLVGDIFDLWVGGDEFFINRYRATIELVQQLRTKNVEVIYFEGNHDLHLHRTWERRLGCRVLIGPRYFDLGPFRVRVEHGDQMNPDDTGYLILRAALRTRAMKWLAYRLPGAVIQSIGNAMSRSSRKWTSSTMKARNETAIRSMVQNHARKVHADDEPFDLIVSGHVHVRDDFTFEDSKTGRPVRSINLGWWPGTGGTSTGAEQIVEVFRLDEQGGTWVPLTSSAKN